MHKFYAYFTTTKGPFVMMYKSQVWSPNVNSQSAIHSNGVAQLNIDEMIYDAAFGSGEKVYDDVGYGFGVLLTKKEFIIARANGIKRWHPTNCIVN